MRLPVEFSADPVWPWSLPHVGLPALVGVALLLAGLTLWTYRGSANASRRRIALVVTLRLLALLLALLTLLRPSFAFRDDLKVPSTLLIALDASKSMTIRDEVDNKSRWATLQRILTECKPQLDRLHDRQNVQVVLSRFADEVADFTPDGLADGPRTDFGRLLHTLAQQHGQDRDLRGLLILSDGADNGTLYPAFGEAARWRALGCPISTFGLGQSTTGDLRDIALTAITPEPSPVPIKAKLAVRVSVDAPGFENRAVRLRLYLDDKEVSGAQEVQLPKTTGNEVTLTTDAPATPGEVKVTVKAEPLPGEASVNNNEISTYLTVTKEGLSVLIVDRLREELKFIRYALSSDPRIRLFEAVRQTDDPPAAAEADLYRFDKQAYDVIILGDVSARRLRAGNPNALAKIEELVKDKGVGLLMMGGADSLGGDWRGTPVADALPVLLDGRQIDERVAFEPTPEGLREYALRLEANPTDNQAAWRRLAEDRRVWLNGFTHLGNLKPGAIPLAKTGRGDLLLATQTHYGKGRTMALAADTTWLWTGLDFPKSTAGMEMHAKFWKQIVVWLAQQEDREGSVWVRPDSRRLAAGGKLGFSVGLRGKTGIDLPDGQFEVRVEPSGGGPAEVVATAHESDGQRGTFWKTNKAGEYRLVVRGTGKDVDGTTVSGEAAARFLIYQDDTELLRQAADHDFLTKLAAAGGGQFHRADELPKFLQEMEKQAPAAGRQKVKSWPDWRRTTLGGFLPSLFVLFVTVLGLEWGLRPLVGNGVTHRSFGEPAA